MTDFQILRNECEQAILLLENAILKCLEADGGHWVDAPKIAGHLGFNNLLPHFGSVDGTAICRTMIDRMERKGLLEVRRPGTPGGRWGVRRKL